MKSFHCSHCQSCGQQLAYLPDRDRMAAIKQGDDGLWRPIGEDSERPTYRLCANYFEHDICNWAIPAMDSGTLCGSCRLTRVIPDVTVAANKAAWYRLEVAKRRLIYTLKGLKLPLEPAQSDGDGGLVFEFLQDTTTVNGDRNRVLTGHNNGVITINVAEADDLLRERERLQLNEPYRTLLGHFRHEAGHYYWDRLIQDERRLTGFRAAFGDERADYAIALNRHYQRGAPEYWEQRFVSAYASAHPWEDWAESWAHYLHMTDALETASSIGLSLQPPRADEPSMPRAPDPLQEESAEFDQMMRSWLPVTYVLNSLNRGLGRADCYPFVLSAPVVDKLHFVHQVIAEARLVDSPKRAPKVSATKVPADGVSA
jgi:hypothetical protein